MMLMIMLMMMLMMVMTTTMMLMMMTAVSPGIWREEDEVEKGGQNWSLFELCCIIKANPVLQLQIQMLNYTKKSKNAYMVHIISCMPYDA